MENIINYAENFGDVLSQAYQRELTTAALTTDSAKFLGADVIKLPTVYLGGYKAHSRSGGWNRQPVENDWEPKKLQHDRDVEFLVDAMDVDETNQALSAANITSTFIREHAVPELDCYRFYKLYREWTGDGSQPLETEPDADNVLELFDDMTLALDEAEVPGDGRILYVTPKVMSLLKNAASISRGLSVQQSGGLLDRRVTMLDNVTVQVVPSCRMLTSYDFDDGCEPLPNAHQIHMILMHPSCVIAPIKHSAIYLFAPGEHTEGDGYLYQNRLYTDLFLLPGKADGVRMVAERQRAD